MGRAGKKGSGKHRKSRIGKTQEKGKKENFHGKSLIHRKSRKNGIEKHGKNGIENAGKE